MTSSTVMNAFYVPDAGRHGLHHAGHGNDPERGENKAGVHDGISSNYSGAGFSHMKFAYHGVQPGRLRRLGRRSRPAATSSTAPTTWRWKSRASRSRCAATAAVDDDLYYRS
jgi:cytochrome o ubiquinol oxidase subunit 2